MTPEEVQRLQACAAEIAEILYRNTNPEEVATLEGIEKAVRQQVLEYVSPKIALFLSRKRPEPRKGDRGRSKVV